MDNRPVMERFMSFVDKDWQWIGAKNCQGYGWFSFNGKPHKAHRISYLLFIGPIPKGLCVLHDCDNPSCVNPEHLHIGTPADNNREMCERKRNTILAGSKNGHSKLTEDDILKIKNLLASNIPQKVIAKQFNVTSSMISHIATGRNWSHVN